MKGRFAILAAIAAAAAHALSAQAPASGQERPQARPLRHDAAAVVKLITVRVLGPDSRPLTGLRKEDFKLTEDGQPKTITEFEVHAITPAGMTMMPAPPPSGGAAAGPAGATDPNVFF